MAEYIEREALLNEAKKRAKAFSSVLIYEAIKEAPAADVDVVVRCKNCKYSVLQDYFGNPRWCCKLENLRQFVNENHFCGYGERRAEE